MPLVASARHAIGIAALVAAVLTSAGCSFYINRAVDNAADNLSAAILNQDDPETVKDGAPAYLLLMDSLVEGSPDNSDILQAAASLYSAYAAVFVTDEARAGRLAERAFDYAGRGLCAAREAGCGLATLPFDAITARMGDFDKKDVPSLYTFAVAWLVYIRTHADDWTAIADLPKAEAVLERILALDETYKLGSAHAILGVLQSLRPPALGGEPDRARQNFERAIAISGGRDLSVKVEYARTYARLLYDRELHDRLLTEVLETDPHEPGLTLMNTLAQRDAADLLASADDYF